MSDDANDTGTLAYIEGLHQDRIPGAMVPEFHEAPDETLAHLIPQTRPEDGTHKALRNPAITMPSFAFISTNGTALDSPIPFGRANTVRVDNLSPQWCKVGGVFVNPFSVGWFIPLQNAAPTAKLTWEAPPTVTQPGSTTGANAYTIWYEERFTACAGTDVAGAASSTLVTGNQTPGDAVANPTDAVDTRTFIEVWNGATWDRWREAVLTAATVTNTGVANVGISLSDGANLRSMGSAGAIGDGGALLAGMPVGPYTFDGTNWNRLRGPISDAQAATGLLGSGDMVWNGTTWDRLRGSNTGATGALATTAAAPTAANMLAGFANVQATTTTTLVTVPSGRTWVGYVGVSASTAVAAGGSAATVSSVITTANGTGTPTPAVGSYTRVDASVPAVGAALSPITSTESLAGQRMVVQAAGGTCLIQHVGTIVAGTAPQASGWAIGELM